MATLENVVRYPHLQLFILNSLAPLSAVKPKVFEQFVNFTGLSSKDAANMLRHGFIPVIRMKNLGRLYGYTPPTGDDIQLNQKICATMESLLGGRIEVVSGYYNHYAQEQSNKELMSKFRLFMEVTILHELVHFGRQHVRGYNPDRRSEELQAVAFEKAAYGKKHTLTSLGLTDILAEPMD
jgi:hypothetical protein